MSHVFDKDNFLSLFENSDRAEALAVILAERIRQENKKGFDPKHDDDHDGGELAAAAACYALNAMAQVSNTAHCRALARAATQDCWPWDWRWWKPSMDGDRDLAKAGALILAELERRARMRGDEPPAPKKGACRHYKLTAIPERGAGWLRCLECGREYQAERPNSHQVRRSER